MSWRGIAAQLGLRIAAAIGLAATALPAAAQTPILADRMTGDLTPVHDPAIIKADGTYYVFSTNQPGDHGQIQVRTSKDLLTWTRAGSVFPAIPDWAKARVKAVTGLWAPDISVSNGQFRLYYAVSSFGSNASAIGLATATTLDPKAPGYGWTDQGLVFASSKTNDYNAIDPAAFTDADGKQWLAFGSFWGGIKMIGLDSATGKPLADEKKVWSLVQRNDPDAVEAAFLIRHGDYYYLFASYDLCCRGADSTYYTVVGRSKAITGPYVDYDGKAMMKGYAQVVLHAKLDPTGRWRGPGHVAVLHEGTNDFIVYHAYDAQHQGVPTLRIQRLGWTADGWPVAH